MERIADADDGANEQVIRETRRGQPTEDAPKRGEGASPFLTLEGFTGPLDHLLTLARAQRVDLAALPLTTLVDQLVASLRQAPAPTPLGQKGDWVVMAAWLVQLRSRLLLPVDAPVQQEAAAEASQLRQRLAALQEMQALAGWLERQPQLGRDVFARGHPRSRAHTPKMFGVSVETTHPVEIVAFLWDSLALFDDGAAVPDTTAVYRPRPFALYAVAEARERILRQLGEAPGGALLDQLLPDAPEQAETDARRVLRQRSAWSSTLVAGLELAKQGNVVLGQEGDFQAIHVIPA